MVLAMIAALGGCEQAKESFGMARSSPDEFAVVTRAPLSVPPEYGLRPPTPGAQRPQEATTRNEAREILINSGGKGASGAAGAGLSPGEAALLGRAGAANVDPAIREKVARESAVLAAGDKNFVERLVFWHKDEPPGVVVDADAEARRLKENAALGDAATKGSTPVIQRRKKGLLEGIF